MNKDARASSKLLFIAVASFSAVFCYEQLFNLPKNGINPKYMIYVQYIAIAGITFVNFIFGNLFGSELSQDNLALENKKEELEKTLISLRETQSILIQKEKLVSLGTFAAGIGHELNNTLNYASMAIPPLQQIMNDNVRNDDKDDCSKLFASLSKGINLSIEIIKNLKSISILDRGEIVEVDICQISKTVISILKSKLTPEIEVVFDTPRELKVRAIQASMNQILTNLISNAIDALHGKGRITITAKKNLDNWELSVKDTGEGIPKEHLDRIYEAFFTTKETGKGTGLGLFLVQKEVVRHLGNLTVDSSPGVGTTFSMVFPNNPYTKDPG